MSLPRKALTKGPEILRFSTVNSNGPGYDVLPSLCGWAALNWEVVYCLHEATDIAGSSQACFHRTIRSHTA